MDALPLVSIVVPARNERANLEACLASVAAQAYPLDRIEVLIVDGDSSDGTAEVAAEVLARLGLRGDVLHCATGTIPANLNVGLSKAHGEVLCRVDAGSRLPGSYIARCVSRLTADADVVVVGGAPVALAPRDDVVGRGIARALNNRWGMGFSRYRTRSASGESDTVYLGAFRVESLRRAGGWNECLLNNQDFDLNRRMGSLGRVWFEHGLKVAFVPRSTFAELFQRHRRFGHWKVRYWRRANEGPRPRQWLLLLGPPLALAAGVGWAIRGPRLRRLGTLAALGTGGVVAVEVAGCDEPAGEPGAHVVACAALVIVGVAWLFGIVEELIRPRREA